MSQTAECRSCRCCADEHHHDHHGTTRIPRGLRLALGAAALAGSLLLPNHIRPLGLIAAYLILGTNVMASALRNALKGDLFNEFSLMSIATLGAIAIGELAEGAAVMLFYEAGELLQDMTAERSRRAIEAAMDLRPKMAHLITPQGEADIPPDQVETGSTIIVRPGEMIPLDGQVTQGRASVDTSSLTGEGLPVDVAEGDPVQAGTMNLDGHLKIRVTRPFDQSAMARGLQLLAHQEGSRTRTERFISAFARRYTPAVMILAALISTVPPALGMGSFRQWAYRGLVFLVVSCPCALMISVPLAVLAGLGASARRGLLLKGGDALERLWQVRSAFLDKTGTLTKGTLRVLKVTPAPGVDPARLMNLAAAAEMGSNHPAARAIAAQGSHLSPEDTKELPGMGVEATVDGSSILVGNRRLMESRGVEAPEEALESGAVHVAENQRYLGSIQLGDQLREDAQTALDSLRRLGLKPLGVISGDRPHRVEELTGQLPLDIRLGDLLPADKVEVLKARPLSLFVGDGINDAAVMAASHVGIAVGGLGADVTVEASDGVLLSDRLSPVAEAVTVARMSRRVVGQNIAMALSVKAAVLILGTLGAANMWEAVFADVGVALLATLNSCRVLRSVR
jgi:Cd2+/Zn2+-exporting ATPase